MATRIKTIEYGLTQLTGITDNVVCPFQIMDFYIPEFTGSITFKRCMVEIYVHEGAGMVVGNYTSRRIDVSISGATASFTNANLYTGSGEEMCLFFSCDCTSHFVTNWTGSTSVPILISTLIDSASATPVLRDVGGTVTLTYEYDDTQSTQIKTVYIPLNNPVTVLGTSKSAAPNAIIPAIDTELPEDSKTYRNLFVVTQGNINNTASTTDSTISMQFNLQPQFSSQTWEMGATSDYWTKTVWNVTSVLTATTSVYNYYIWGSVARYNHHQSYLGVTYEFDATSTANTFVSLKLPADLHGYMGGTTANDYSRAKATFYIEEPATITTKQIAFYYFWEQSGAIANLFFRLGSRPFLQYTDAAAVMCGGNGAMMTGDTASTSINLVRGKNTITADAYRTDTTDFGWSICGFFIVNYTAGKPAQGYGAANRTIMYNLNQHFNSGAAAIDTTISSLALTLTETDFYFNSIGINGKTQTNGTATVVSTLIQFENTTGETGLQWIDAYSAASQTGPETGLRQVFNDITPYFYQWTGNTNTNLLNIEYLRRWKYNCVGASTHKQLDLWITLHNVAFTVSGTISNSLGGIVTITLHRDTTGEDVLTTTRTGNGSYSFSWFDSAENVFVEAYESVTYRGRSKTSTAGTGFDISLTGGAPNYAFIG